MSGSAIFILSFQFSEEKLQAAAAAGAGSQRASPVPEAGPSFDGSQEDERHGELEECLPITKAEDTAK